MIEIGRLLDQHRWSSYQKLLVGLVFLALVVDGIANQSLSISMPALMHSWSLPKTAFASVTALGQAGLLIGALVGGTLGDRFGRRKILLASIFVFALSTLALAGVPGINSFGVLRFCDGLGIGSAIPLGAALVSEFTPSVWRSRAVAIALIAIPVGSLSGGLIGSVVLPHWGWRALFLINGVFAIAVGLLLLATLPESPRYLARRPHRAPELIRLLARASIPVAPGNVFTDTEGPAVRGRFGELFAPALRANTGGIFVGFFFVFLAVYATLGWVPALLASHGFSLRYSSLSLSAYSTGGIVGGLLAPKIIEARGSRTALVLLGVGSILSFVMLSMLPLSADEPSSLLAALGVQGLMLNGLTTCLYAMGAHVFPPPVRATGMGSSSAMGRVGAVLSAYAAIAALQAGPRIFFLMSAAMIMLGMIALLTVFLQIERRPRAQAALL